MALRIDWSDELWRDESACQGMATRTFFPEDERFSEEAKEVCQSCVVRLTCLAYAFKNNIRFGIWGGMTASQRRLEARRRRLGDSTYQRHDKRGRAVLRLASDQREIHLCDDDLASPVEATPSQVGG